MIIPSEDRSVSEAVRVRRSGHVSGAGDCACSDARPVSQSLRSGQSKEGYWCSVKAAGGHGHCLL